MDDPQKIFSRKFGANRNEDARKLRRRDPNSSQSRDIREDRGERQIKAARSRQTLPHVKPNAPPR